MWTCQQDACGFMSDLFWSSTREMDNGYFYSANNIFDEYVSQCDTEIHAFHKCEMEIVSKVWLDILTTIECSSNLGKGDVSVSEGA
jgi:hypothetical protein